MLGFIRDDATVGIYTMAFKFTHLAIGTITATSAAFLPRLSFYDSQGNTGGFSGLLRNGLRFMLGVSIPSAAELCLLSRPLILLAGGDRYGPSVPVMMTLSPLIVFLAVTSQTGHWNQ